MCKATELVAVKLDLNLSQNLEPEIQAHMVISVPTSTSRWARCLLYILMLNKYLLLCFLPVMKDHEGRLPGRWKLEACSSDFQAICEYRGIYSAAWGTLPRAMKRNEQWKLINLAALFSAWYGLHQLCMWQPLSLCPILPQDLLFCRTRFRNLRLIEGWVWKETWRPLRFSLMRIPLTSRNSDSGKGGEFINVQ